MDSPSVLKLWAVSWKKTDGSQRGDTGAKRNGSPLRLAPSGNDPPTPTWMRLESMGAAVLTMWTLGVDVERMRWSGALAGAGKGKCSGSRCGVQELAGERL